MHSLKGIRIRVWVTYDEVVMEWHFKTNGDIPPHAKVSSCTKYISRQTVFDTLFARYNMGKNHTNLLEEIILPSTNSKARTIVKNADAAWCIQSLLTDPRIVDEDYLFWGDDPLSPPPHPRDIKKIGDINTGRAYIDSYRDLIKFPGQQQVLLPIVIIYTDGTATGQFTDLPVTPNPRQSRHRKRRKLSTNRSLYDCLNYMLST